MNSYEIMRRTISKAGVKAVAADMALSSSLVYKWCQEKGEDASGADNPLDRVLALCEITGDCSPIVWLCEQVNGFFVENITPDGAEPDERALAVTQRVMMKFSELLEIIMRSIANDNGIDKGEARSIRVEWEAMKRVCEQFVLGCEMGHYLPAESGVSNTNPTGKERS